MRLIDALEDFYLSMDGVKSKRTVQWYSQKLYSLSIALGDCSLEEIDLRMLRRWRADLASLDKKNMFHPTKPTGEGELSRLTIHGYIRACRRFFSWCEEEGILAENIAKKLEAPPKPKNAPKGIKENARDLIIEQAKNNPRDYALVLFLADTACRAAGIAGLRMEELDLNCCAAVVHEKGRGGNNKARLVYFGNKTKRALEEWLEVRPDVNCPYVFINTSCGRAKKRPRGLTVSGVYQVFKRLGRSLGIDHGWNPHNWRHGAARGMLKNGASLIEVSQLLGHSSVSVTGDFYGIVGEEELHETHRAYGWIQ